jgi:hypothetical protein
VAVFTVAPPAPVPAEGGAAAGVLGEPAVPAGELPHAAAARVTPASTAAARIRLRIMCLLLLEVAAGFAM